MMEPRWGALLEMRRRSPKDCGEGTLPRRRVGAAPARGVRDPAPGRPREPIGRYYGRSAGSLLDWDCANDCRRAEEPSAHKGTAPRPTGSARKPGNADPGNRNRRDGAPRGARVSSQESAARLEDWCATRCSIPSLFARGR